VAIAPVAGGGRIRQLLGRILTDRFEQAQPTGVRILNDERSLCEGGEQASNLLPIDHGG
jgi:hypothetical protein